MTNENQNDAFSEKENNELDRRCFLKTTGIALASLAFPLDLTSCTAEPIVLPSVAAPTGSASVGIVRKAGIEEMVRTAIDLAGGLSEIKSGDRVVIKPNITGPELNFPARIFTHPEVIRAVVKAVKEKTPAGNITVAEASAFRLPTQTWARRTGILSAVEEEGANFVAWETGEYVAVTSDAFEYLDFMFRVPKSLMDGSFDHFINVPILKNHDMVPGANVDYTCCIKNHVGVVHPMDRLFGGKLAIRENVSHPVLNMGIHKPTLGEISAEINMAVPKHTMNVVDALSIVLTGGPAALKMDSADAGLILASKDRVACDSLAVAVLKHYAIENGIVDKPYVYKSVWDQAQIRHAQKLNLGRYRANIIIKHDNVDNIDAILGQWV